MVLCKNCLLKCLNERKIGEELNNEAYGYDLYGMIL